MITFVPASGAVRYSRMDHLADVRDRFAVVPSALNYINVANDGDWHDGRMLASGPRTNPWCQEASPRRAESGDLVGVDTDMVGPSGYFADVSRTFHCGPARPTRRQKEPYRLAVEEIASTI